MENHESIINGTKIANNILDSLKNEIASSHKNNQPPKLVVILVGDRKDSDIYVRMKQQAAQRIGIIFELCHFNKTVSQTEIEKHISQFNTDSCVHGIIVQLPLPTTLNETHILQSVISTKDVDGFHALNSVMNQERMFTTCTPQGIMMLLRHIGCKLEGTTVVMVGCGNVGMPLAVMLMQSNATVICCNKETQNIKTLTNHADILVAAAGCPELIKRDWVKPGVVIIDVGINSIRDPTRKSGFRLVGDVDYADVAPVASRITPVPGGVGPMTVAMLMSATVDSWRNFQ